MASAKDIEDILMSTCVSPPAGTVSGQDRHQAIRPASISSALGLPSRAMSVTRAGALLRLRRYNARVHRAVWETVGDSGATA